MYEGIKNESKRIKPIVFHIVSVIERRLSMQVIEVKFVLQSTVTYIPYFMFLVRGSAISMQTIEILSPTKLNKWNVLDIHLKSPSWRKIED